MDVNDLLIFAKVAQAGSFTRAAGLLSMPVSTVSRRVADLEEELGVALLVRTTRSLKITEVGKAYLAHGQVISTEIEKADALASNLQSIPQGTLKITASTDFGNQFLSPIVHSFIKANPRVKIDIVLTERVVDLVGEGFDLAIRMGHLPPSTLIARKVGTLRLQLYASPAFLKAHGEPRAAVDLAKFDCVLFSPVPRPEHWTLKSPRGEVTVKVAGRVTANNMLLVRNFAIAGDGIALMPHFLCIDEVRAGRLKVLLKDWTVETGLVSVVYPEQRYLLPKVRAFVDHLASSCETIPWRYKE